MAVKERQTVQCECGATYKSAYPSDITKHRQTEKHSAYLAAQLAEPAPRAVPVADVSVPKDATPQNRPDLFGTRGQIRPDGNGGITSAMVADKPEYATPDVSDVDSGFYVGDRGLPWHVSLSRQLGVAELMADAGRLLTTAEAIELGGFDFHVDLLPITPAGSDILIPNKFATVRSDTGAPLGVVGPAYKVFQNADVFGFADNLVDSGEAKWETAGVARGGSWTFISMELDHLEIEVPGDRGPVKTYLLLINSFDGSRKAEGHITQVRAVCKNTCKLAKGNALTSFAIRHSGTLEGKIEAARKALGISFKNVEFVKGITTTLARKQLVDSQVREIFEKVWPIDEDASEAIRDKAKATQAFLNYQTSDTLEGIRGTAWGALNAATELLDHEVIYKARTRGTAEDTRFDNLMFGDGADSKERLLTLLLKA